MKRRVTVSLALLTLTGTAFLTNVGLLGYAQGYGGPNNSQYGPGPGGGNYNNNTGGNGSNYGTNFPPMSGGSSSSSSTFTTIPTFNPQTGTWSNNPTTVFNPKTGTWGSNSTGTFNPMTGTWGGSSGSGGQGGSWNQQQGANGGMINVFTPSQVPSGSMPGANLNPNSSMSSNSLYSGPRVVPRVAIKPRPSIYSRVNTRPRF